MVRSLARPLVFVAAIWVVLFAPAAAAADPIAFRNTSYIFGYVSLLQDGTPITVGDYYDTAVTGPRAPLFGTWAIEDSRTIGQGGASATVESSVGATMTGGTFTGWGRTLETASADGTGEGAGAQSWARSVFNVSFELAESSWFTYSGRYYGETDAVYAGLLGRLEGESGWPVLFSDEFRTFTGAIDERRSHSGLLQPGSYSLILVSDPVYVIAPGEMRKAGGFEFAFQATPIPEPGTMILLGTGLAVAAGRALRRRRPSEVKPERAVQHTLIFIRL